LGLKLRHEMTAIRLTINVAGKKERKPMIDVDQPMKGILLPRASHEHENHRL